MTELIFRETTIRKTPVSFAIDITPMLAFGVRVYSLADKQASRLWGWHDLNIYVGPLSLTFTVYGRGA